MFPTDDSRAPSEKRPGRDGSGLLKFANRALHELFPAVVMLASIGIVAFSAYKVVTAESVSSSVLWIAVLLAFLIARQWQRASMHRRSTKQAGVDQNQATMPKERMSIETPLLRFEQYAGFIGFTSGILSTITLAIITVGGVDSTDFVNALKIVFWVFFGLFTLNIIFLFTRTLPKSRTQGPDPDAEINALFRVSYIFVAFVVLMAATLMVSPEIFRSDADKADAEERVNRALAIVRGCDYASPDSVPNSSIPIRRVSETRRNPDGTTDTVERLTFADPQTSGNGQGGDSPSGALSQLPLNQRLAAMPPNAHCGDIPPQWVLSIGGNILMCHINGTCWSKKRDGGVASEINDSHKEFSMDRGSCAISVNDPAVDNDERTCRQLVSDFNDLIRQRARAGNELRRLNDQLYETRLRRRAGATAGADVSNLRDAARNTLTTLADRIAFYESVVERVSAEVEKRKSFTYNVPGTPIVGGIVVPIYFLAVAVLGACVGMVRKLPEYQYRATEDYKEKFDPAAQGVSPKDHPLEAGKVRDLLIFQTVQVVFAPAIALIAYSFARPSDVSAAVILAFAAGYSSEIFLVVIRDLSDRLIGLGLRPTRMTIATAKKDEAIGRKVKLKNPVGTYGVGSSGQVVGFEDGKYVIRMDADERNVLRSGEVRADLDKFRGIGADQ